MELVLVLPATQVDDRQTNKDLAIVNLGDSKQNPNKQTNKQTNEPKRKEPIGYIPKHGTRYFTTSYMYIHTYVNVGRYMCEEAARHTLQRNAPPQDLSAHSLTHHIRRRIKRVTYKLQKMIRRLRWRNCLTHLAKAGTRPV